MNGCRFALTDDVRDEIGELRQSAQHAIAEANCNFAAPGEPLIYRDAHGNGFEGMLEKLEKVHREPSLEDTYCKPRPGSGWPTHPASDPQPGSSTPLPLRDDPLAYINRMVTAYDADDRDTFRQMTEAAANDPFARHMQALAAAQVNHEEQLQAQRLAEQQRLE